MTSFLDKGILIGGAVYQCEKYIDRVFNNIQSLSSCFEQTIVVMAIDYGTDDSLKKLQMWQNIFKNTSNIKLMILEGERKTDFKIKHLSYVRNRILDTFREIYNSNNGFNYFIMMDCDEVCANPIRIPIIQEVFKRTNEWDAVTFIGNHSEQQEISKNYYDFWALSLWPFILSCWHFKEPFVAIQQTVQNFEHKLEQPLEQNNWIPCQSAFNGFGIYRIQFLKYHYDWELEKTTQLVPKVLIEKILKEYASNFTPEISVEDCEHRHFHFSAFFKDQARIYIVPKDLFGLFGSPW
jgi:hypothetical protein